MSYRTISRGVLSLAILAMSFLVACKLIAANCANLGPVAQGCSQGQGADSGCAGGNKADCEADIAQVSAPGQFGCIQVQGRKNCRDGVTQALCYTRWHCVWIEGCLEDPQSKDEHTWWIKTSDECTKDET